MSAKLTQTIKAAKNSKNKQEINIIIDALRKQKRKRKAIQQQPQEQQQEDLTLEQIANTIKPQMFYPSNVVTVNPYGATTPTMFDVSRLNEMNARLNRIESMKNNIEDAKVNVEPLRNSLMSQGKTEQASQISSWLNELMRTVENNDGFPNEEMPQQQPEPQSPEPQPRDFRNYVPEPANASEASEQGSMSPQISELSVPDSDSTVISNYENIKPFNLSPREQFYFPSPVTEQTPEPASEQVVVSEPKEEQASTGLRRRTPQRKLFSDDEEDEEDDGMKTPDIRENNATIDEIKEAIDYSIDKHPQKRVIRENWKKQLEMQLDRNYSSLRTKEQKDMYKIELRDLAIDFIDDMINGKDEQSEMRRKLSQAFAKGKQIHTQINVVRDIFGLEKLPRPPRQKKKND